jgi:alanyl-tRNA synthetase
LTRKLYQEDSYVAEFTARVISIEEHDGKQAIELDATHFYPEAGGQPCDTGTIGNVRIDAVLVATAQGDGAGESNSTGGTGRADNDKPGTGGRILHITTGKPAFSKGAEVEARIDWPARFLNMQQHTGQHILSQAFLSVLDAATVSSHLGAEHCTVDVSRRDLTWEDMEKVEKLANSIVFENRPVRIYEISPDEVEGLRRKEPAGLDRIRVVEIEGFDKTPCGGTHTRATGEVGPIKILRWEKVRETTRVEFVCGELARRDYFWKSRFVVELAQEQTTKDVNVPDLVRGLYDEHKQLRFRHEKVKRELMGYRARTLFEAASREIGDAMVIVAHIEDAEPEEILEMAGMLTSAMGHEAGEGPEEEEGSEAEETGPAGVVALLASGRDKVNFVFARSENLNADMRPLIKEATSIVDGKGGGRPEMCQGGGHGVEKAGEALEAALELLAEDLCG